METRADGKPEIVGYAAVYFRTDEPGTEYQMYSDLVERIMPGAFDRALREKQDVRALFNHNPENLLGRTVAGTLTLSVDDRGLFYRFQPPDTTIGRDVLESINRGDLSGSSFAFTVARGGAEWHEENGVAVRILRDVNLFDVGPVTFPAYGATSTGTRADGSDDVRQDFQQWKTARQAEADAVSVRVGRINADV